MNIIGIIPSRYQSKRFPGKPLADVNGKSMIRRVYEQAKKAKSLSKVVVATDDSRIQQHVKSFGGEVVMTSSSHKTGTDRCNEAVQKLGNEIEWDVVINIQGDEPFIHPGQVDEVAGCFNPSPALPEGEGEPTLIATLIKQIDTTERLLNPNVIKVIINKNKEAIYFSRAAIPFFRNKDDTQWLSQHKYYRHIGIYGYRLDILRQITRLEQSPLEIAESLEQLRWIENGYKIKIEFTDYESAGVDAPEDLVGGKEN
ncbi:MAG: 3-deoxy-manno-octulosonate cytidylyltransferase [Bacteroidota bacterium]